MGQSRRAEEDFDVITFLHQYSLVHYIHFTSQVRPIVWGEVLVKLLFKLIAVGLAASEKLVLGERGKLYCQNLCSKCSFYTIRHFSAFDSLQSRAAFEQSAEASFFFIA